MPEGAYAVVLWQADDPARVVQKTDDVGRTVRSLIPLIRILVEVHGMNPKAPPPPFNEKVMGYACRGLRARTRSS